MSQTQSIQQRTSTAVVSPSQKLRNLLDGAEVNKLFKRALGEHKDQFIASLIDLYSQDSQLQECDPGLVIKEAVRAATLHLPLAKFLGYAYIVVYKNSVKRPDGTWAKVATPTFMIGYKGLIDLAHRSRWYRHINAGVIYEGEMVMANKLTGEITLDPDCRKSDKIVGYFAHFESLYGFSKTLFMSLEDMAKYAKRYSKAIPKEVTWENLYTLGLNDEVGSKVGWMGNFNEMAQKTVLRRLLTKWGHLSIEMQEALAYDDEERPNERESILEAARGETQTINLDSSMYSEVQSVPASPEVEEEEDDEEDPGTSKPQF